MRIFQRRFCLTPVRTSRVTIPTGARDYYVVNRVYIFGLLVAEFHEK